MAMSPAISAHAPPRKETSPGPKLPREVIDLTISPAAPVKASPQREKKDVKTEEWPALPGPEPRSRSSTLQSQSSPWGAKQRA